MACTKKEAEAVAKTLENTNYWFHDFMVKIQPDGSAQASTVDRTISPGVQVIVILIVLIIVQLVCPQLVHSLADLIINVVKSIGSKENTPTLNQKGFHWYSLAWR